MNIKCYHIYFGATRESFASYPDTATEVSLRGWLLKHDIAKLLSSDEPLDATEDAVKTGIAGPCGKSGAIFGLGVEESAEKEAQKIHQFLLLNPDYKLIILGFGFSRGAIGLKLIVEKLSNFSIEPHRLRIHLALHDPVPGNSIKNKSFFGGETLAQKSSNLSKSEHISDVLCLYAQEKGITGEKPKTSEAVINSFFVRQMSLWPADAYIEADVYAGNHLVFDIKLPANTKFASDVSISPVQRIICERTLDFLYKHGYRSQLGLGPGSICSSEVMQLYYEELNTTITASKEVCHDLHSVTGTLISAEKNIYYNAHHYALVNKQKPGLISSNEHCSLRIERSAIKLDFYSEILFDDSLLVDFCNEIHGRLSADTHDGEKGNLLRIIIEQSLSQTNIPLNILFVLAIALALQNDVFSENSGSPKNSNSSKKNKSLKGENQEGLVINLLNLHEKYRDFKNFSLLATGKRIDDLLEEGDLLKLVLVDWNNTSYFNLKNSEAVYHEIKSGLSFAEKKVSVPDSYNASFFHLCCDDGKTSAQTRPNQRSFRS